MAAGTLPPDLTTAACGHHLRGKAAIQSGVPLCGYRWFRSGQVIEARQNSLVGTIGATAAAHCAAHSLTKTEAKAATYTETSNNEYYTCSVCQKVFKDAAGTQETTVEAETESGVREPFLSVSHSFASSGY